MPASVICVSHTEGAGGEEVARAVAARLGYRYVDDEIIFSAAEVLKAFPDAVALAERRGAKRTIEVDFHRFERVTTLRELIRQAVRSAADEGEVVIVAHAAAYALADREGVVRVLVTASDDVRKRRLAAEERRDESWSAGRIRDSDRNRANYLRRFYDVDVELPVHYDLVVSTDKLSPDTAAEIVATAASNDRTGEHGS